MRKHFSSIVLLAILMLPAALGLLSTIKVVAATGNVTINDFTCQDQKGTIKFTTRLNGNVSGQVTGWRWDFYNPQIDHWSYSGNNNSLVTTSHTFGAAGAYGVFNVTLHVWGPGGSDSLKKIDFVVGNKNTTGLPVASFSSSATSGDAPLNVTFTDSSKNASSVLWYFGLTDSSTEKNPSFTFNTPGKYRVVQEVKNSRGWDATAQDIIVGGVVPEKVYPTADFEVDTTNGLSVQFNDLSQNGNTFNWSFGDGNTSNENSPLHNYSKAGDFTVHLTVSNENGTNLTSKIITVQNTSSSGDSSSGDSSSGDSSSGDDGGDSYGSASVSSSSSGGSGGSGGGGASPEPQENVEAKELSQTYVGSGQSVSFAFPQKVTPVLNISFDSKKTVGKITTIVEMLKNQSTLVSGAPSDSVYKFINIWVGTSGFATPDNIENAVVEFKVEKSWVLNNSIDKASITLNRFNDSKWDALPTNLSGEDDQYLYFTTQTPGFSSFAITGKAVSSGTENETQTPTTVVSPENNNTSNATNVTPETEQTSSSPKTPGFEALIGILGLFGAFLYKRK